MGMNNWNGSAPGIVSLCKIHGMDAARDAHMLKRRIECINDPIKMLELIADHFGTTVEILPGYPLWYVNIGDPYHNTLLYNEQTGHVWVSDWGHWLERRTIRRKNWSPK